MKKTLLIIVVFAMSMTLTVGNASAWYFSLENANSVNLPGESVIFNILFNPDAGAENGNWLEMFQLDFEYDIFELDNWTATGSKYTSTAPSPLVANFMGPMEEADAYHVPTPGHLRNFNQVDFFSTGVFLTDSYSVGTITFDILEGALIDGTDDIWFENTLGLKAKVDGEIYHLIGDGAYALGGENLDVGAVPIPGAIWLLASGFLGLIGLRRKS